MQTSDIKELLRKTRSRRHLEVTLSTGAVFEMWYTPLSDAEDARVRESIASDGANAYGYAVLIQKAENEDGSKMFARQDVQFLRNEVARVDIVEIMSKMVEASGVLQEADSKSPEQGSQE